MVVGDNGIIAKTQSAKKETEDAQSAEENQLKDYENTLNNYSIANRGLNKKDILFSSGEGVSATTTYNLSKNANDYDMVIICGKYIGYDVWGNDSILKEIYSLNEYLRVGMHDCNDICMHIKINGDKFQILDNWNYKICYIFGIKF